MAEYRDYDEPGRVRYVDRSDNSGWGWALTAVFVIAAFAIGWLANGVYSSGMLPVNGIQTGIGGGPENVQNPPSNNQNNTILRQNSPTVTPIPTSTPAVTPTPTP